MTTTSTSHYSVADLKPMRQWVDAGNARSLSFRLTQLRLLKQALLEREQEINKALYEDLRKSPEEVWATELGLVHHEIDTTIRNLKNWMRPKARKTNLLNWPSQSQIRPEPKGLVLIISPWNYPLQLLLKPAIGAMAAGNAMVLKASEHAPATAALLSELVSTTFDQNYMRLLVDNGATVIPSLMRELNFDHVFFTGSTTVGQSIYQLAAEKLTPVTLELGGKSPCVIEADANLTVAARRIASIKFSNCGQMCVAPDYLLIHESIQDRFLDLLKQTIQQFYSENPARVQHYGKIIHAGHFDRLTNLLRGTAPWTCGQHDRTHLFFAPTLIENIDVDHPLMQSEIFGPILPVFTYRKKDDALSIIRRNPDPLAFYVFTENNQLGFDWVDAVPAGGACINQAAWHLTNPNLPFGGRGASGIGAYQGEATFLTFSHLKSVMRTPTWFDPMFKYPPFKGKLKWLKRFV